MTKNPYQPPAPDDSPRQVQPPHRLTKADLVYFPLAWGVVLFIGLVRYGSTGEITPDIPLVVKTVTSLITAASLVSLLFVVRGWKLILAAPLWLYLIWVQYLIWTFYANR